MNAIKNDYMDEVAVARNASDIFADSAAISCIFQMCCGISAAFFDCECSKKSSNINDFQVFFHLPFKQGVRGSNPRRGTTRKSL